MINTITDEQYFWSKINTLKTVSFQKKLPSNIVKNKDFYSLFIPDIFYGFPLFFDTISIFLQKSHRANFYITSISPDEITRGFVEKNELEQFPLLEIKLPFNHIKLELHLNKHEHRDTISSIINADTGSFSHVWAFDDTGDWLICNQRQDVTLFSTSNKKLMSEVLSLHDKTALWIPKGYDLDPENLPPYITRTEFDEGYVNEAARTFTLELLKNYQWKDFQ